MRKSDTCWRLDLVEREVFVQASIPFFESVYALATGQASLATNLPLVNDHFQLALDEFYGSRTKAASVRQG